MTMQMPQGPMDQQPQPDPKQPKKTKTFPDVFGNNYFPSPPMKVGPYAGIAPLPPVAGTNQTTLTPMERQVFNQMLGQAQGQ